MNTYQFYIQDDPELYHWSAATLDQARQEIVLEFEIDPDDIEAIAVVRETAQ
jgi:hypothetical protein